MDIIGGITAYITAIQPVLPLIYNLLFIFVIAKFGRPQMINNFKLWILSGKGYGKVIHFSDSFNKTESVIKFESKLKVNGTERTFNPKCVVLDSNNYPEIYYVGNNINPLNIRDLKDIYTSTSLSDDLRAEYQAGKLSAIRMDNFKDMGMLFLVIVAVVLGAGLNYLTLQNTEQLLRMIK